MSAALGIWFGGFIVAFVFSVAKVAMQASRWRNRGLYSQEVDARDVMNAVWMIPLSLAWFVVAGVLGWRQWSGFRAQVRVADERRARAALVEKGRR